MSPRHGYATQNISDTDQELSNIILDTTPLEDDSPYVRISIKSVVLFKGFMIAAFDHNANGESFMIILKNE